MTGRNRRTSTSSLESVDHNQTPWRQESSVLKTVSKDLHENDWPIFELRDAVVLNKDGKTLESVLDVGSRGPFTIRGTLIIEEQPQRRQRELSRSQVLPLESSNSGQFLSRSDSPLRWKSVKLSDILLAYHLKDNPSSGYKARVAFTSSIQRRSTATSTTRCAKRS